MAMRENLLMGTHRDAAGAFKTFPQLKERVRKLAGTMSGGEQAMLVDRTRISFVRTPKCAQRISEDN